MKGHLVVTDDWSDRLSSRFLGVVVGHRTTAAVVAISFQLAAAYALGLLVGGASRVPPHWFYLPILYAGLRFGVRGAVPTAVVGALLAGPLTLDVVATGTPQELSDWAWRGVFFVVIGATLPAMMRLGTDTIRQDRRNRRLETEVRRALQHGEFVLFYQPIVDLRDGRIVGAEALLRWQHPQRGMLAPAAFIADVERIGSIATWVLFDAATTVARWRRIFGLDDFYISVNVSAQNLALPNFVADVRTAMKAAQLDPRHLCVEVTESAMIGDVDNIAARLQVLRSIGARVAVDDFGTGHATLSYLQELPIDVIKIDQSFVNDLGARPRGDAIVTSVLQLARNLGATCVAEGVETSNQRDILSRNGCTLAQGYFFAQPVPAHDFEQLLTTPTPKSPPRSQQPPTAHRRSNPPESSWPGR
jgi:EAL domain-containing protein (putative c-di-GMP-specific phosphodiesterase class I)